MCAGTEEQQEAFQYFKNVCATYSTWIHSAAMPVDESMFHATQRGGG
jgi:hypothetical protein